MILIKRNLNIYYYISIMVNINLKKLITPIRSDTHVLVTGDPVFTEHMKRELLEENSNIKLSTVFNSNDTYDYIFIFEHSTVKSAISLKSISVYLSPLFAPAATATNASVLAAAVAREVANAESVGLSWDSIDSIRRRYRLIEPTFSASYGANDLFMHLYDKCTQNNECLVIDMNSNNRIEDSVYWYRPYFKEEAIS